MARKHRVKANTLCPCNSGRKFKRCCSGKVDWQRIIGLPPEQATAAAVPHLCARGKNRLFLYAIHDILQLDKIDPAAGIAAVKRAVTPDAVRRIHEVVVDIWPDLEDLGRVLFKERERTSGLYTGNYHPDHLEAVVARHALYTESLLLIDPFAHPMLMREQYNPLAHPEQFRSSTMIALRVWLAMAPWVEEGVVCFVRSPCDLSLEAARDSLTIPVERQRRHPELRRLLEAQVRQVAEEHGRPVDGGEMEEFYKLSFPDERYIEEFRKEGIAGFNENDLREYLRRRREDHPWGMLGEEEPKSELLRFTSGTNYDMARAMAAMSGSHLITDMPYRWKEIEIDRHEAGVQLGPWTPFAKAFGELRLSYLDGVALGDALALRKEGRLQDMRSFLGTVWRKASNPEQPFAQDNAEALADELHEKVREADAEFRTINARLADRVGRTVLAGAAAATGLIASGHTGMVPAALTVGSSVLLGLGADRMNREAAKKRFPAAFFLGRESAAD